MFASLTELNVALFCRIVISTVIKKQSAHLGDEVWNWKIILKALTQNNKCSKRFPRTIVWQRHVVPVFLRILVICLIRDNNWKVTYFSIFFETAFYFLLLRSKLRIRKFMGRFLNRKFFHFPNNATNEPSSRFKFG